MDEIYWPPKYWKPWTTPTSEFLPWRGFAWAHASEYVAVYKKQNCKNKTQTIALQNNSWPNWLHSLSVSECSPVRPAWWDLSSGQAAWGPWRLGYGWWQSRTSLFSIGGAWRTSSCASSSDWSYTGSPYPWTRCRSRCSSTLQPSKEQEEKIITQWQQSSHHSSSSFGFFCLPFRHLTASFNFTVLRLLQQHTCSHQRVWYFVPWRNSFINILISLAPKTTMYVRSIYVNARAGRRWASWEYNIWGGIWITFFFLIFQN